MSTRPMPEEPLGAALLDHPEFYSMALIRREFITDVRGDLWCIEIRKHEATGSLLKGRRRVIGRRG